MDKTKRQKRIIQKKRNLKKWIKREKIKKKVWNWGDTTGNFSLNESDWRRVKSNANHGKRCSCDGCGNQRHAFGRTNPTMQEKKEKYRYDDYFDGI